jgi:hypothetical protein
MPKRSTATGDMFTIYAEVWMPMVKQPKTMRMYHIENQVCNIEIAKCVMLKSLLRKRAARMIALVELQNAQRMKERSPKNLMFGLNVKRPITDSDEIHEKALDSIPTCLSIDKISWPEWNQSSFTVLSLFSCRIFR